MGLWRSMRRRAFLVPIAFVGLFVACSSSEGGAPSGTAASAADASNGKPLWSFQTSQLWKASPMTYMFDNKQHVAIASGSNIIAFALPD